MNFWVITTVSCLMSENLETFLISSLLLFRIIQMSNFSDDYTCINLFQPVTQ